MRPASMSRPVMTVDQVAEYLQVNKLTVYKYIRDGRLPAVRLGRAFRILREDVDRFLDAHRVPAAPMQAAANITRRSDAEESIQEIHVGPSREEQVLSRDALISSNPIDWVIRGLH